MSSLLTVQGVSHTFGGLQAIVDFNLSVGSGEIVGVIGPNGAGKTTLFNLLCGVYPVQCGAIQLDEHVLNGLSCSQIARLGIARTFQNIRLFPTLSVVENIKIAIAGYYNVAQALLRGSKFRREEQAITAQAHQLLEWADLTAYMHLRASELPYGLQRRLEIARALAMQPKVLLLDEPACGMNPAEVQQLIAMIRQLNQERALVIVLIDHQMHFVMNICQQISVLNFGKTIAVGSPEMIRNHDAVIASYLGTAC